MKALILLWQREPVAFVGGIIGIIDATIGVAVAFGLQLNPVEIGAVAALELAIGTFIQRSQVSPAAPEPAAVAPPARPSRPAA